MKIPKLKKIESIKKYHGISLEDNYAWVDQPNILEVLKDPSKLLPDVKKYIEENNIIMDCQVHASCGFELSRYGYSPCGCGGGRVVGNQKQLPDIYKPKEGLGFFGYIFLIIIIGFSVVGVLKTFENDLLNLYPEAEFIFEKLNEQLVYVSESVKNIVVIVSDLINSY